MITLHDATPEQIVNAFLEVNMERYFQGTAAGQPNYTKYRDKIAQKVVDAMHDTITEIGITNPEARATFYTGFEAGMEVMRILNEK